MDRQIVMALAAMKGSVPRVSRPHCTIISREMKHARAILQAIEALGQMGGLSSSDLDHSLRIVRYPRMRGKAKGKVPAGQILVDSFGDEMYRKVRISALTPFTDAELCKAYGNKGETVKERARLLEKSACSSLPSRLPPSRQRLLRQ